MRTLVIHILAICISHHSATLGRALAWILRPSHLPIKLAATKAQTSAQGVRTRLLQRKPCVFCDCNWPFRLCAVQQHWHSNVWCVIVLDVRGRFFCPIASAIEPALARCGHLNPKAVDKVLARCVSTTSCALSNLTFSVLTRLHIHAHVCDTPSCDLHFESLGDTGAGVGIEPSPEPIVHKAGGDGGADVSAGCERSHCCSASHVCSAIAICHPCSMLFNNIGFPLFAA